MRKILILFLVFIGLPCLAQQVINVEKKAEGDIHLAEGIAIPKINPGFTLWAPETGKVKGLIVFTHPRRDTLKSDPLIDEALKNQLAVLYATTDNRLEFFFEISRMEEIESYIFQAIEKLSIPKQNLLFCGMSLEGTRSLKAGYIQPVKRLQTSSQTKGYCYL